VSASARVIAPEIPLYQMGNLSGPVILRKKRPGSITYAPKTPMYLRGRGLGATPGAVVAAGSPIAATATTAILSSSAFADTAIGSAAGPIGAAVGLVVGLVGSLLAGHELRAKQAKNENSAVNIGVSSFDSDLKQILAAYKAGQIDASGVAQAAPYALQGYWTIVGPQLQPGRNGCSTGSTCPIETPGQQPCTGSIGAGCCVACYQLSPGLMGPNGVLAAIAGQSQSTKGPFVAEIPQVFGSSYGASNRGAYTLDFTPPPASVTAAAAGSLTSALTGASGGSIFPLLLIAGLVYAVTR
jgi:hypothetical protein